MVDIHSHILPGLDDGAESLEEALVMARLAVSSGTRHMAATSHGNYYDYTLEEYRESLEKLQEELAKEAIPLKLYPGMEIFLDDDAASRIQRKELLSLNHTDYLLVEFPFEESEGNVLRRIRLLQEAGWRIVLAHPERYIFVQKDPEFAYYLADQGCVLQINGGSVLGDFGSRCQRMALQLMDDGIAGVIASDAHDTEYRSPDMNRLMEFLDQNFDPAEVKLWISENPSRILKGMPVLDLIDRNTEEEKGKWK